MGPARRRDDLCRSPPAEDAARAIKQMSDDGAELAAYWPSASASRKSSCGAVRGVRSWACTWPRPIPNCSMPTWAPRSWSTSAKTNRCSYGRLLALARAADDTASLAILESVGAPPWTDPRSFGKVRRVVRKYEAKVSTPPPASWQPAAEYTTPKALADYEAGEEYSFINFVGMKGDGMASQVDLPKLGTDFAIPMFFVEGAQDLLATPDVAQRYYDSLTAPQKRPGVARTRRPRSEPGRDRRRVQVAQGAHSAAGTVTGIGSPPPLITAFRS